MKGRHLSFFSVFIFTVILLILRPVIIFSFSSVQAALQTEETRTYGIAKAVRKRQEYYYAQEIINEDIADQSLFLSALPFVLLPMKKWLRTILSFLSFFLSHLSFLLKRRRTLFELSPTDEYYLALSVLRI